MKKIFTLIALVLVTLAANAQSGKSIYQKYSDEPFVTAVYISPAMFRMIGKLPDVEVGDDDINLAPIIKSLSGFYLIDSENADVNASLSRDVSKMLDKGKFELLMEVKEDGEKVRMYTAGDEAVVTSFIMHVDEGASATFIFLDGNMLRKDLESAVAAAVEDDGQR